MRRVADARGAAEDEVGDRQQERVHGRALHHREPEQRHADEGQRGELEEAAQGDAVDGSADRGAGRDLTGELRRGVHQDALLGHAPFDLQVVRDERRQRSVRAPAEQCESEVEAEQAGPAAELQRLTGLEQEKIVADYKELLATISELLDILSKPARITAIVIST